MPLHGQTGEDGLGPFGMSGGLAGCGESQCGGSCDSTEVNSNSDGQGGSGYGAGAGGHQSGGGYSGGAGGGAGGFISNHIRAADGAWYNGNKYAASGFVGIKIVL